MKYIRRYLQEVDVVERTDDTPERSGVVKFLNEYGSLCIMTTKQFDEVYEEKQDEIS